MSTVKTANDAGGVTLSWSQPGDIPNLKDTTYAVFIASSTDEPQATGVDCNGVLGVQPVKSLSVGTMWTALF